MEPIWIAAALVALSGVMWRWPKVFMMARDIASAASIGSHVRDISKTLLAQSVSSYGMHAALILTPVNRLIDVAFERGSAYFDTDTYLPVPRILLDPKCTASIRLLLQPDSVYQIPFMTQVDCNGITFNKDDHTYTIPIASTYEPTAGKTISTLLSQWMRWTCECGLRFTYYDQDTMNDGTFRNRALCNTEFDSNHMFVVPPLPSALSAALIKCVYYLHYIGNDANGNVNRNDRVMYNRNQSSTNPIPPISYLKTLVPLERSLASRTTREIITRLASNYARYTEEFTRLKLRTAYTFLLYGPPGTGKTEFTKYLAQALDRDILIIDTISDLKSLKTTHKKPVVILLDEFDRLLYQRPVPAQTKSRSATDDEQSSSMEASPTVVVDDASDRYNISAITALQDALDGMANGNVLVLTTNHYERIEREQPQLVRMGRVHVKREFKREVCPDMMRDFGEYLNVAPDFVESYIRSHNMNDVSIAEVGNAMTQELMRSWCEDVNE